LQAVALNLGSFAAASGRPSTWLVGSPITMSVTAGPQVAFIAGPTALTGGETMRPWAETMDTKPAVAIKDLENILAVGSYYKGAQHVTIVKIIKGTKDLLRIWSRRNAANIQYFGR